MGGTLSIIITDTMQGLIFFPVILIFIVFILSKFSWSQEIVQVMSDRAEKQFIAECDLPAGRKDPDSCR